MEKLQHSISNSNLLVQYNRNNGEDFEKNKKIDSLQDLNNLILYILNSVEKHGFERVSIEQPSLVFTLTYIK